MNYNDFKTKILNLYANNKYNWHKKILLDENKDLLEYIKKNTPKKLIDGGCSSLSTKIYCILNFLDDFPKCPECGHIYSTVPILFRAHLCGDCSRKDKNRIFKAKKTIENNGGYELIGRKIKATNKLKEAINPNYRKEITKKVKETKLERYGNENYVNAEQRKKTCLERYNVECVLSLDSVKEKAIKTIQDKWGVDNASKANEIKEKIKETHLKNHGVAYPMQDEENKRKSRSTKLKRYNDPTFTNPNKCKQTKLIRYGDPNWNNRKQFKQTFANKTDKEIKDIVDRIKKTKLERYGDENYCNIDKIKSSCMEHFGVNSPFKDKDVQKKSQETYFKKTGYTHPSKNPDVIQKKSSNYFAKTGFSFPAQNPEIRRKQQQKIFYNGINFGSSYELAYFIYLNDKKIPFEYQPNIALPYVYKDKTHYYHPDFLVEGNLIEIKGEQFFKEDGTMRNPYDSMLDDFVEAKHQCMIRNNVKILEGKDLANIFSYIDETYGKNYLNQFRKHK